MYQSVIFLALVASTVPVGAAPAPAPASPTTLAVGSDARPDPERLAVARKIAWAVWPDGTVKTMMGSMGNVRAAMMSQVMKTTPQDLGVGKDKDSKQSLGETIRKEDPNFEERMAITNRVMMDEIGKLMTEMEPQLRESVAELYARKFSLAELNDIETFFQTPSGKTYASRLIPMMADPQYLQSMTGFVPKLMKAMPGIMARIKKETAHLLPPPEKSDGRARPAKLPST